MKRNPKGDSYRNRVTRINAIYDDYARTGLTNREIWRRYIWPEFHISERAFYNILKRGGCSSSFWDKKGLI